MLDAMKRKVKERNPFISGRESVFCVAAAFGIAAALLFTGCGQGTEGGVSARTAAPSGTKTVEQVLSEQTQSSDSLSEAIPEAAQDSSNAAGSSDAADAASAADGKNGTDAAEKSGTMETGAAGGAAESSASSGETGAGSLSGAGETGVRYNAERGGSSHGAGR